MHKDTVEGTAKDAAGAVKKKTGELTDNEKMEAEGAALQGEGKVQKAFGDVKESARDALKN